MFSNKAIVELQKEIDKLKVKLKTSQENAAIIARLILNRNHALPWRFSYAEFSNALNDPCEIIVEVKPISNDHWNTDHYEYHCEIRYETTEDKKRRLAQ